MSVNTLKELRYIICNEVRMIAEDAMQEPTRPRQLLQWLEQAKADGATAAPCWIPESRREEFDIEFADRGWSVDYSRGYAYVTLGDEKKEPPRAWKHFGL